MSKKKKTKKVKPPISEETGTVQGVTFRSAAEVAELKSGKKNNLKGADGAGGKKAHVITNVVYGDLYQAIFCGLHLKSLLDPTNLPAVADRVHYQIFTDAETAPKIANHTNYQLLEKTCSVEMMVFDWPPDKANRKFQERYNMLVQMLQVGVEIAQKRNAYLSPIVADLVFAKGALPKIQGYMDDETKKHDAVFMLPLRSTFETAAPHMMRIEGAPTPEELFAIGYRNLHPLWLHCVWDNPFFTSIPFSMLWNSPAKGLMARSFSVTPIIFKPTIHMMHEKRVLDVALPGMFENPRWCEDWTDAPIIGCEPLPCYWPMWLPVPANPKAIGEWAQKRLDPTQFNWIKKKLYYPSRLAADVPKAIEKASDAAIEAVGEYGGHLL